jgi:hypothetical protein
VKSLFVKLSVLICLASAGCGDSTYDGGGTETGTDQPTDPRPLPVVAQFVVHTAHAESFVVEMSDPDEIASARNQLAGREATKGVAGRVVRGNPGFNRDVLRGVRYSWHLDPDTVHFFEISIEVCDGIPSFVESHLDEWVAQGQFCPWSSKIVQEL